jgi:hypothetical protein
VSWKKEKKSGAPLFLLGSFRRRVVRASAREREKEEGDFFFFFAAGVQAVDEHSSSA